MITKLTPKQVRAMARVRNEWLEIGLRCGTTEKAAAEEAIKLAWQHPTCVAAGGQ